MSTSLRRCSCKRGKTVVEFGSGIAYWQCGGQALIKDGEKFNQQIESVALVKLANSGSTKSFRGVTLRTTKHPLLFTFPFERNTVLFDPLW